MRLRAATEACSCSCWPAGPSHSRVSRRICRLSSGTVGGAAAVRVAFDLIRQVFPPSLCYTKIVPVDEAVTLTLFYREDAHLRRLMLDQAQAAELDRLWAELHFMSSDALTLVDAFQQLLEYASQDADPRVFEPMRKPINERAAAFRRELVAAEPRHLDAIVALADRAFRRPLSAPRRPSSASFIAGCAARRFLMTRRSGWCWPGCWCRRRFFTGSKSRRRGQKPRRSLTGSWRAA